jgi:FKBP-type peptidyl-prolyl cis-trans isomerase FkpA
MKKFLSTFAVPALVVLFFASCMKVHQPQQQQTCTYNPCSYKAPDSEITAVKHYLDSMGLTANQHCSGLFYTVVDSGTGVRPDVCFNSIIAKYKGTLVNGSVFDSGQFAQPIDFGHLIQGWANGVPFIRQGGEIRLYIPPSLGYGKNPYGSIPGNSILIFDINLVQVY